MAEQVNSMRVTRAAKKRAATAMGSVQVLHPQATKKRVILGELTNLKNVVAISESDLVGPQKPKTRLRKKEEKIVEIEANSDDPQMCAPYASDIFEYLHSMEVEKKRRPLPDYMEKIQKDVTANMRGILVDWLVQVTEQYKLVSDTLYLTVSYLDRFLSSNCLHRHKLQLLGVSCMLIASKYEETTPPHIEDFCYITDHSCTKVDIIKMESEILNSLKFEMGNPTINTFLRRFTMAAQENSKSPNLEMDFLGCYLAELSLLDYACIRFLPSMVAASVIFLAKFTIQPKIHPWNSTLQRCSGYKPSDLKDCVLAIHEFKLYRKSNAGSWLAVRDKYKQDKFKRVALLTPTIEIPMAYFEDVEV
ncbi:Cyclin [Macleaya cordata]|uniref:Cyclin n=1 Tax=Macleaya cordata TaxID=56857 RepID=A0A200QUK9_MACCD|nr:Cyclin [Macleaya cordata]